MLQVDPLLAKEVAQSVVKDIFLKILIVSRASPLAILHYIAVAGWITLFRTIVDCSLLVALLGRAHYVAFIVHVLGAADWLYVVDGVVELTIALSFDLEAVRVNYNG